MDLKKIPLGCCHRELARNDIKESPQKEFLDDIFTKKYQGGFSKGVLTESSSRYLKASPVPPAPLAVAGFLVAGLLAW